MVLKLIWKGWLYWVSDQITIRHVDGRLPKPTRRLERTVWRWKEDSKETSWLFTRSFLYSFIISPRAVMIRHGAQGFVCAHTRLLKENEIFLGSSSLGVGVHWQVIVDCVTTLNYLEIMITLYSLKVRLIRKVLFRKVHSIVLFSKQFIFMESMLSKGCMPGGLTYKKRMKRKMANVF